MIVHLLFGTYRFGVNNVKRSEFDSMFGVPWRKRFIPSEIRKRCQGMRFRAVGCYFLPKDVTDKLFK